MKKYFWLFIVAGLNWAVAAYSIIPLLENKMRNEWFAIGIYQILVVIGWASFFLFVFLVSLILKKSRYGDSYRAFRKPFVVSLLGTLAIVLFGITKSQSDFNTWQDESNSRRIDEERAMTEKFIFTVDSLSSIIISSDSSLAEPFFHLGLAYRHQGKWDESVANYRIAVALDQTVNTYFSELAYSQSVLGKFSEAIEAYQTAYQLDSSKSWILDEIKRCEDLKMSRAR